VQRESSNWTERQVASGYVRSRDSSSSKDVSKQRLYFVDIDEQRIYTYEPASSTIGFQVFGQKITSLALTVHGNGVSPSSNMKISSLTSAAVGNIK
jgi:hypothetical protein